MASRSLLAIALLVPLVTAGCAATPEEAAPTPAADAARASPFRCPAGEAVVGFDATGTPQCFRFAAAPAPSVSTAEVSSNLKALSVSGSRSSTAEPALSTVHVQLQLAAGARPMDLRDVALRYADGSTVATIVASSDGSDGFALDWIRGDSADGVMESGDLVQLSFAPPTPIAPRTNVELFLIPPVGEPVPASFKAPATFGTELVITLR